MELASCAIEMDSSNSFEVTTLTMEIAPEKCAQFHLFLYICLFILYHHHQHKNYKNLLALYSFFLLKKLSPQAERLIRNPYAFF